MMLTRFLSGGSALAFCLLAETSRRKHPHDFVVPFASETPGTTTLLPQSQMQFQVTWPWFVPARVSAKRRPNRRPASAADFRWLVCSDWRQPQDDVLPETTYRVGRVIVAPQSQANSHTRQLSSEHPESLIATSRPNLLPVRSSAFAIWKSYQISSMKAQLYVSSRQ